MEKRLMIFDVDGVLIEADGTVREAKYKKLFEYGMKMVKSDVYKGSSWLFETMKDMYDDGIPIEKDLYKLTDKNIPFILAELYKKYDLYATSAANEKITKDKLKATGIWEYFQGYIRHEDLYKYKHSEPLNIMVDDRPKSFPGFYFVKFEYGQYREHQCIADKRIYKFVGLLYI